MARQTNNRTVSNEWETVADGIQVKRGRDNGFSLNWFGAVIYGCRIVNGRNGAFISWPSFKGQGDKYIKRAYVYAAQGSEDKKLLALVVDYLTK